MEVSPSVPRVPKKVANTISSCAQKAIWRKSANLFARESETVFLYRALQELSKDIVCPEKYRPRR